MMNIRKQIREILKKNNIKYSVRDYYKLEHKHPGLSKQYGITYFIDLPTVEFYLKLKLFKESGIIHISYKDGGENNYFHVSSKIENFDEKISTAMYLIESHLKCISDMSSFESGKTPINVSRGVKIAEISNDINNI